MTIPPRLGTPSFHHYLPLACMPPWLSFLLRTKATEGPYVRTCSVRQYLCKGDHRLDPQSMAESTTTMRVLEAGGQREKHFCLKRGSQSKGELTAKQKRCRDSLSSLRTGRGNAREALV